MGGVRALVNLPGKMWAQMWGKSTPKCGANPGQILGQKVGQNLWQSHDSSRRGNPENRWKSLKMITRINLKSFFILANGSFWARRGLEVGWGLAG